MTRRIRTLAGEHRAGRRTMALVLCCLGVAANGAGCSGRSSEEDAGGTGGGAGKGGSGGSAAAGGAEAGTGGTSSGGDGKGRAAELARKLGRAPNFFIG